MKQLFGCVLLVLICSITTRAQEKFDHRYMNYYYSPKPNTIIYNDTLYRGSREFRYLFYRQRNPELIRYFKKHQANKISGQIIGFVGTIAIIFGVRDISQSGQSKGNGWALAGGGFAATLFGGYLSLLGQANLQTAVALFNQQNHRAGLGIGASKNQLGLVYKW